MINDAEARASSPAFSPGHSNGPRRGEYALISMIEDVPGGSDGKASMYNAGDRVRSLGREDPLEKEMATHSSVLVWRIPWTEEPGRLQSMGSQRIRHN